MTAAGTRLLLWVDGRWDVLADFAELGVRRASRGSRSARAGTGSRSSPRNAPHHERRAEPRVRRSLLGARGAVRRLSPPVSGRAVPVAGRYRAGHGAGVGCRDGERAGRAPARDALRARHATDASAEQIANAPPHPSASPTGERRYDSGVPDAGAQLVTVGQALHWFDLPAFLGEVRRILQPGGVLAAFAYGTTASRPRSTRSCDTITRSRSARYWPREHLLIHDGYRSLALPIDELVAPPLEMREDWVLEQYIGYLRTWSATQRMIAAEGEAPVLAFERPSARRGARGAAHGELAAGRARRPAALRGDRRACFHALRGDARQLVRFKVPTSAASSPCRPKPPPVPPSPPRIPCATPPTRSTVRRRRAVINTSGCAHPRARRG
jgi:hypothetical protein